MKKTDDIKEFQETRFLITEKSLCVFCHNPINKEDFRDRISFKEYSISGLCQKCQDDTFGV